MQVNSLSYAHSPLDVLLAPIHFSEQWHRLAPKSIQSIDRLDALTELIPARHMRPDATYRRAQPEPGR